PLAMLVSWVSRLAKLRVWPQGLPKPSACTSEAVSWSSPVPKRTGSGMPLVGLGLGGTVPPPAPPQPQPQLPPQPQVPPQLQPQAALPGGGLPKQGSFGSMGTPGACSGVWNWAKLTWIVDTALTPRKLPAGAGRPPPDGLPHFHRSLADYL